MSHNSTLDQTTRGGERGASLVEASIVFLVVAIVLAFALPAASNSIRAYNLRSAGNHLAERISAVRALALAKNKNVTFSFNNTSGRYGFDFDADGVPDTIDPDEPADGKKNYYWETLPSDIAAVFPNNAPIMVTFNSRGELPIGTTAQSITIGNRNTTLAVRVNLRGKVSVE
ncbi:MAG TPA: hypothetical protein VJH03_01660 [Blastocatellia bacterium]|nr:hypothetical protein [Blastocatellia bacterium]